MSPNTILPQFPYTLSYFLTDHTDNSTYYVRAIIYDATTGEILDTQNLTRQTTNTRLYSKVTQAPGDSSGQGRKIVVVATAYSDSGYTTKADYQEQSEVYVVRKAQIFGGGNGNSSGSFGTDYGKIREIFQEEIVKDRKQEALKLPHQDKTAKPIEMPKMEWEAVLGAISSLKTDISSLPKEATDLSTLHSHLNDLSEALNNKEVTPVTDLTSIMSKIDELETAVHAMNTDNENGITSQIEDLKKMLPSVVEESVKKVVSSSKFMIDVPAMALPAHVSGPKKQESLQTPFDISKLMK